MYCGIDVSKGKSNVCILSKSRRILAEFAINHDFNGFNSLKKRIKPKTKIALESTGNYSKAIYSFLKESHNIRFVDSIKMKSFARLHYKHIKNDKIDARLIALYLASGLKTIKPGETTGLKDLCRLYYKIRKDLTRHKLSFKNQLSIIFPELEKECYMKSPKGIAYLLLKYSTPYEISNASVEDIYLALVSNLKKPSFFSRAYALKIKLLAKTSIGVDYPVFCFKHTLNSMLALQKEIDAIMAQMRIELDKTPYCWLLNEKGYNIASIATIAGEVGDIRRFPSHRQFVKYCGLDVSEARSGSSVVKAHFTTRHGNRYLRSMFYNLVLPHLAAKDEFSKFYYRLKKKGKHPCKCMVAVSRKLAVKAYWDLKSCHE